MRLLHPIDSSNTDTNTPSLVSSPSSLILCTTFDLFNDRVMGGTITFVLDIETLQQAERALQEAERAVKEARDVVNKMRQEAEQGRERRARQVEPDRVAARAAEETGRMRAQMIEAATAAKCPEELAEASTKAAKEDAARLAQEAQEERERFQKIQADAARAMAAARKEAERAQKAADEQRAAAEAGKALVEEMARAAAEEARKANEAKAEAEGRLTRKEDIQQPVVTPTLEELAAAKRRIQYREDRFHFAVAGISGSGKSSLVNAFRGLRRRDAGAAAVGVTVTTLLTTRYADANPDNPYVWYDIPGAGTIKCCDWQYFNDQGLYVFDCIVVLFDNRFTMTEIAILTNARRFKIPTYIVRSKADQRIRNVMMDMGYDSEGDDEQDVERRNLLYKAARKQFVENTRKSVKSNLEDANLPDQRVYIVSDTTLLSLVLNKVPKKTIDEVDLLNDLLNEDHTRRDRRVVQ